MRGLQAADLDEKVVHPPSEPKSPDRRGPLPGTGHGGRSAPDIAPFLFRFPQAERGYGPDLFVADESAFEADGRHADAAALSLVAEFTSVSAKDADGEEKLEVYGQMVPVCLVVDMQESEVTCFSDPSEHGDRSRRTVSFGKPLEVPEPFGFELDTAGLV
ncbi:Uma2 family endonuclease [Streptomyces sp. NPDC046866]|uniref:Uma2 family endonuclease n=1 Tax=Streptomyces sp. NPDC046866 TaxID=3154921 RepID=UPI003452997C